MSNSNQEIEAKFYVDDLDGIKSRLQGLEARLIQPRVLETNIRFDLPDGRLRSEGRVLRLRQDTEARLAYKGTGTNEHGILSRTEIEFVVEDFEKARQFLEALGYLKVLAYDKYRSVYELEKCHVMLDELPVGHFVEIEGKDAGDIQNVATKLNLNMGVAIAQSYSALFESVKKALELSFQDLSYENFTGIHVTPDDLGVHAADVNV
jgi:adenylate cyclase class 2